MCTQQICARPGGEADNQAHAGFGHGAECTGHHQTQRETDSGEEPIRTLIPFSVTQTPKGIFNDSGSELFKFILPANLPLIV
jgi:hypothetical protein